MKVKNLVLLGIAIIGLTATPISVNAASTKVFFGIASNYGHNDFCKKNKPCDGSRMANGKIFSKHDPTVVAHKNLPFGTKLRVSYNGKQIIVTVQDRGPFVKGRVIDLSWAAAKILGLAKVGVGRVRIEILGRKTPKAKSGSKKSAGIITSQAPRSIDVLF